MNYNLFSANRFTLSLPRAPMFSHFAQVVTPAGYTLPDASYPTRPTNIKVPGSTVAFDTLTVTANMDQQWLAFEEIHNWIRGMATPYHNGEWMDIQTHFESEGMPRFVINSIPNLTKHDSKALNSFSDATIFLKDGHNNTFAKLLIDYIYPNNIQPGDLDTTTSEGIAMYPFSVTFAVSNVEFERTIDPWA